MSDARCLTYPLLAAALAVCSACQDTPQLEQSSLHIYRFDDELDSAATVSAPQSFSSFRMADRVIWDFNDGDPAWRAVRGKMELRSGELVLRGAGAAPVIVAPDEPSIDWSRYETVLIRMRSERGGALGLKIGDLELSKTAAAGRFQVHRFDLNITDSSFRQPLAIMPAGVASSVTIDSVELVPREVAFTAATGRMVLGKQDEYRSVMYAHSPSSITYEVDVPIGGKLHLGVGVTDNRPVSFRVTAAGDERPLYSKTLDDPDIWDDAAVDLSSYEGRNLGITFETTSEEQGIVGLWANPLITSAQPKSRPNVLIYTACTLRPDRTSLYGHSRKTTPFLEKLGASSVVFDDCQAQGTWTKASVSSLMTSLHTFTHGVADDTDSIPPGATTMAQRLRSAGYVTASVVSNPFAGRVTGLDRGFDMLMEYPVVQRETDELVDRGTDSAAVNRVVFPWLERHRDEPFFLFVLSTDPHAPYEPPAEFESLFANPNETPQFDREYSMLSRFRDYGGAAISQAEIRKKGIDPNRYKRRAMDRYDAEVAHQDRSIEMLLDRLTELGLRENTLLIVLSDHGEEFWEHGWSAHGHTLYQELTHTALLMSHPSLLPDARRVAEPVQLIDVMPTVLDLLDIEPDGLTQGQSLVPLMKGLAFNRQGPVMSSRFGFARASQRGVPEVRTGTFARITPEWKLIYRDKAEQAGLNPMELYDRRTDRVEANNVAARYPEEAERLMSEMRDWIDAQKEIRELLGRGRQMKMDPKALERLRSLGYIGGASGSESQ